MIGALCVILVVLLAVAFLRPKPEAEMHPELTMEAGGSLPSAWDFLVTPDKVEISYLDTSAVQANVPGVYDITLTCQGKERQAKIRVKDTVNPTGKTQNLTALSLEIPAAEAFVVEIQDATDVTVSYLKEPDKNLDGEQNITIVLTDTSGNVTHLQAVLTLIIDREAPVIEGVADKILYQGDTISYMPAAGRRGSWQTFPWRCPADTAASRIPAAPGAYTVRRREPGPGAPPGRCQQRGFRPGWNGTAYCFLQHGKNFAFCTKTGQFWADPWLRRYCNLNGYMIYCFR